MKMKNISRRRLSVCIYIFSGIRNMRVNICEWWTESQHLNLIYHYSTASLSFLHFFYFIKHVRNPQWGAIVCFEGKSLKFSATPFIHKKNYSNSLNCIAGLRFRASFLARDVYDDIKNVLLTAIISIIVIKCGNMWNCPDWGFLWIHHHFSNFTFFLFTLQLFFLLVAVRVTYYNFFSRFFGNERKKIFSTQKKNFETCEKDDEECCVMLNYLLSSSRIVFAIGRFSHTWFACWAIKLKIISRDILWSLRMKATLKSC